MKHIQLITDINIFKNILPLQSKFMQTLLLKSTLTSTLCLKKIALRNSLNGLLRWKNFANRFDRVIA